MVLSKHFDFFLTLFFFNRDLVLVDLWFGISFSQMIRDLYFVFFLPISCFVIAVFYFEEPNPWICWKTLCFILKNQIQGFVKNSGVFIYACVLLKIWSNGLCGHVVKNLEHLFMPAFVRSGTFTIMPTFYKDLQQILYAHILSELCHSFLHFCKIWNFHYTFVL